MSEFNLQSVLRPRMHLYVNPYTHDYEITDIPTKYQVQHIGQYVGSFLSYYPLSRRDVFHCTKYKIIDQAELDKRYGEDGKRTDICFTCNKAGHWARNCPDKEKQTWTIVFVYVNPYTHELKILPTWKFRHQFQNMIYVGALKSLSNEYKIKSPQITILVESQTEQTKQDDCEKMQNDNTSAEINSSQSTILVESQDEQIENMQNDNTSITDSEICQTAERLERLAKSLNIPNLDQYRSLFKPEEKNQINNQHLTPSEKKDSKKQDSEKQDSEKQDNEKQDSKDKKKKNCYFCKSKKHGDKICPDIIKKNTRGQKRKSDSDSDIPNKKRKLSKIHSK